jgi:hypothetical protein
MANNRPRRRTSQQLSAGQSHVSSIDFHRGEVLWTLANTYPSLMLTLVEMAQNGIDADAQHIFIGIDLKRRRVIAADDGSGASIEKFEQALASVGKGVKQKGSLGQFGRGLIAPLNKCLDMTFTSKVEGYRPIRWAFRGSDIRAQHRQVEIPREELTEMPRIVGLFSDYLTDNFDVQYNTIVRLEKVIQSKVITLVDLDELEGQVRTKLGMAMRKHGVSIRVVLVDENGIVEVRDIHPVKSLGEPLGVVNYIDADGKAGRVSIDLYRAPKIGGSRKGEVLVMEYDGNYPVTMREVENQFRGGKLHMLFKEIVEVLTSGFFEGIIRCEGITLHPERTKFEYDDALSDLFMLLGSSWYEQYGKAHYENEQERSREQRYQRLGLESLDYLRASLPPSLWDMLRAAVKIGRLGEGHVAPAKGRPNGFEEEPSLRTGQGGAGTAKTPREHTEPRNPQEDPKDRPGDMPTGALGPDGRERRLVRGDSEGLWFEYSPLFANSHLWEFNRETGVLTFNIKHPVWVSVDETNGRHTTKNARQVKELQEWLAHEVLRLLVAFPEVEEFEQRRGDVLDAKIKSHVEMFILRKGR